MALKLCQGDPLMDVLRQTFHANIVRVPEARVQPVGHIAVRGDDVAYRGNLGFLLHNSAPLVVPEFAKATAPMADVSGKESRSVDVGLGLEILGGFLNGIPGASISGSFSGAREVSFTFGSVKRTWVDEGWLGHLLPSCLLDLQNLAVRDFVTLPPWSLLIVTSIVTSNEFTLTVTKTKSSDFALDVPAINGVLAQSSANFGITAVSERAITFKGRDHLTFAFTTVRAHDEATTGRILSIPAQSKFITLAAGGLGDEAVTTYGLDHVELAADPTMIEFTA